MISYILRRMFYAVPILLGVNLLTFLLFFFVNSPDDVAWQICGPRSKTEQREAWKREHGYHLPRIWNDREQGLAQATQTIFFTKSVGLMRFEFGRSDRENVHIGPEIRRRMFPSLAYAIPTFLLALFVEIVIAMLVAYYRGSVFDLAVLLVCVLFMSIAGMFYIIGGQVLFGMWLKLAPISGYAEGLSCWKFLVMPVLIGIISGLGGGIRFTRTVFLEEVGRDYVRTARAKGLSEARVLFVHVLKNAMIPILTSVVFSIPFLFMGSLTTENFFAIPGLGGFTISAIQGQDFAIVRSMVFLGSVLYIVAGVLTDISYVLVDPRVRLEGSGSVLGMLKGFLGILAGGAVLAGLWSLLAEHASRFYKVAEAHWDPDLAQNLFVVLLVLSVAWFLWRALPREPWRTASRQIRANRPALVCLVLLAVYVSIGLIDSVAWKDPMTDAKGGVLHDKEGGVVLQATSRSLLDRAWDFCRGDLKEKSYSAPLADVQFTRNMVQGPDGKSHWEAPPLRRPGAHLLGTDKVGKDVLFVSLKSIRTGLVIGGITTLIAIPFAMLFGILAGYFGGWVDDLIQYVYTTLASIPGILLIVAFVLIFGRGLLQLCIILGITSWTGLCRLTRAETLKLREMDYVKAAEALGSSRLRILFKHVAPNLMHLVLISAVLQFSGLVLAESVLAYVGVGVGAGTSSWGNMINAARLELSREPVILWNLLAAFVFMLGLVLPANLFGDALRDALDPRLRRR